MLHQKYSPTTGADANYEKDLKEYQKADNNAMVVLTNSMTVATLQKVMRFESAREIWNYINYTKSRPKISCTIYVCSFFNSSGIIVKI